MTMKGKTNELGYIPPFTVSAEAITLIAEISAQIERYAIRLEQADGLKSSVTSFGRMRRESQSNPIYGSFWWI